MTKESPYDAADAESLLSHSDDSSDGDHHHARIKRKSTTSSSRRPTCAVVAVLVATHLMCLALGGVLVALTQKPWPLQADAPQSMDEQCARWTSHPCKLKFLCVRLSGGSERCVVEAFGAKFETKNWQFAELS
jgi:hypothetical protein